MGFLNGPCVGVLKSGLAIGPEMSAEASAGDSGIFFNGRQLHAVDAHTIKGLGVNLEKGRYFLDDHGHYGPEGSSDRIGQLNLMKLSSIGGGGRKSIFLTPDMDLDLADLMKSNNVTPPEDIAE